MRQTAASNLGSLSAMSVRVDTLANDLVRNAQEAAPAVKESYLTALRGVLASSGQRISPATLTAAGAALKSLLASAGSLKPCNCCCWIPCRYEQCLCSQIQANCPMTFHAQSFWYVFVAVFLVRCQTHLEQSESYT